MGCGAEGVPIQAEEGAGREMEHAAARENADKQSGAERYKTFRDPIYGYIYIEESVVRNIIDTATFQRLRDIRQTSYAPLYPAALHNRFIHSIGVYYLGQMAFDALVWSAKGQKIRAGTGRHSSMGGLLSEDEWSRCRSLFSLACLLHDVGHAPFSHTGEDYYREGRSDVNIRIFSDPVYQKAMKDGALSANEQQNIQADREDGKTYSCQWHLFQLTKDPVFVSSAAEEPAAHEIMSCIVALETFGEFFRDDLERAFVARCITGLTYIREDTRSSIKFEEMNAEEYNTVNRKMLMDCVIQLLHSSVIDVDRLDYIIRDATTIGYQSVSVDYQRLLNGITLVREGQFTFRLGFHKNAVSVIENAVYAHDNEKKWVQGHPTILYEGYLIQETIRTIEEYLAQEYEGNSTLFSFDSLTEKGSMFSPKNNPGHPGGVLRVSFLSDADLLYLMKNVFFEKTPCAKEYFWRNLRRHPVWKSEAEYRSLFDKNRRKKLKDAASRILGHDQTAIQINQRLLDSIDEGIEKKKNDNKFHSVPFDEMRKKYCQALLELLPNNGEDGIVLLSTSFFKSNFVKGKVQKLNILFPEQNTPSTLEDVSGILSGNDDSEKFFYLFYYPGEGSSIAVRDFADQLCKRFDEIDKDFQ